MVGGPVGLPPAGVVVRRRVRVLLEHVGRRAEEQRLLARRALAVVVGNGHGRADLGQLLQCIGLHAERGGEEDGEPKVVRRLGKVVERGSEGLHGGEEGGAQLVIARAAADPEAVRR